MYLTIQNILYLLDDSDKAKLEGSIIISYTMITYFEDKF